MRFQRRIPVSDWLRFAAFVSVLVMLFWSSPSCVYAQELGTDAMMEAAAGEQAASRITDRADSAVDESGGAHEQIPRAGRPVLISTQEAEMELSWTRVPERVPAHPDPYRFWKWPVEDALALVRGVPSDVTLMAAGGGAVLLIAARHDPKITADLSDLDPEPPELLVRVVEEFGNVRSVRPLAGVVFLGTLMTDDYRLQDAAFTSFQAIILGNLVTSSLKTVFGRARPFQNEGALEFKPFSGNTSFPSGHATTAFAFITPWLLYYPNAFTPGLVVLGTGTAFTRMLTRNHWFTDVVAGSAIGFATAYLLTRRHQDENSRIRLAPSVSLDQVGLTVAVKMP